MCGSVFFSGATASKWTRLEIHQGDFKDSHMPYPKPAFFLENHTDKHSIPVYHWAPVEAAKAIIHISHGMAEHIGRYNWLISKLNADGYHVIARDHRGHGSNIINGHTQGFFADTNGNSIKNVIKQYLKTNI